MYISIRPKERTTVTVVFPEPALNFELIFDVMKPTMRQIDTVKRVIESKVTIWKMKLFRSKPMVLI